MNVLVTGGLGVVGRPVVARLLQHGHAVRVLDRLPECDISGVEYTPGNVTDMQALRLAVHGQQAVIHLAAIPTPDQGNGPQIFHTNCSGTFNVYAAASEEGIRRVVCASSINFLGYYYGSKEFSFEYFPVDEDHPNFTTDAYSFSKQITEQIAAYYWRRDGITSLCLRLPAVLPPESERFKMYRQYFSRTRQAITEMGKMSAPARQQRYQQLFDLWQSVRSRRLLERSFQDWPNLGVDPQNVDMRLVMSRANLWAAIHADDSAQAFEKSILADVEGCYPLFVNNDQNWLGVDSELLAQWFFPEVQRRKQPLTGAQSLVSAERARQIIGFSPEHPLQGLL